MLINQMFKLLALVIIISFTFCTSFIKAEETSKGEVKEDVSLKNEIINLNTNIIDLTKKIDGVTNNQELLSKILNALTDLKNLINTSSNSISNSDDIKYLNQLLKYKDAFILNPSGAVVGSIDNTTLKIYGFNNGNLLGFVDLKNNIIIRNEDKNTIAKIENDFLINEIGEPIGSIERSSELTKAREKLNIQKTPESQYTQRNENKTDFNLSSARANRWSSTQSISDLLFIYDTRTSGTKE